MMYTKLSVNINKIATLRNSRGGNMPNLITVAQDCVRFGADGITVHPRPDERHIRYDDVYTLSNFLNVEFNIEGNPMHQKFIDLVLSVKPTQVTLVPDSVDAISSNAGWDCIKNLHYLKEIIQIFKQHHIRTSIFLDPIEAQVEAAKNTNTDRIELYTESYAKGFVKNPTQAIAPYIKAVQKAQELNLDVNAGHDLNLENLAFLKKYIPMLHEVSIGHALICEALYMGLENTIQLYKQKLQHFYK